jgi:hypothetical protein
MPITFKRFDYVKVPNYSEAKRVSRVSGPYVYLFGELNPRIVSELRLIEPKFKAGDVVCNGTGVNHTIAGVKNYGFGTEPWKGAIAYDYTDGGWDIETALTFVRRSPTIADVINEWRNGRPIQAIKDYRTIYGASLKEAKDACEAIGEALKVAPVAAPAPTIKAGDKVKHARADMADIGTGTVLGEGRSKGYWRVRWTSLVGLCVESEGDLVVVESAPTAATAIVAVFENGKYRPNSNPYIHASKESAIAEAERLSRKHPGTVFGTFVLVADSETAPAATKTVRV